MQIWITNEKTAAFFDYKVVIYFLLRTFPFLKKIFFKFTKSAFLNILFRSFYQLQYKMKIVDAHQSFNRRLFNFHQMMKISFSIMLAGMTFTILIDGSKVMLVL